MSAEREFTISELATLSSKKNLHILIHGKVYDVHLFMNEHPGGDLVLLGEAGKDSTKGFEDVQHSDEAKELMKEYVVGYCPETPIRQNTTSNTHPESFSLSKQSQVYSLVY